MQIFEAAAQSLANLRKPSRLREILNDIERNDYFAFGAKDPLGALNVAISRHARGVEISKLAEPLLFYRHAPATYGLLEWLTREARDDLTLDESASELIDREDLDTNLFLEEELHRWLFKNLEANGLTALGFGALSLVDVEEQSAKSGKYNTGIVGEIDMLLKNEAGDYIVLELKRGSDDKSIGQLLRYVGWVREELAPAESHVFGRVLAQRVSDRLRYALKMTHSDITCQQIEMTVDLGPPER